jgi:nucleoid-associated protein YgaU
LSVAARNAEGNVLERVRTPFASQPRVSDLDGERMIVVQPGSNLWTVARRTYGEGVQYTTIYNANEDQIDDPDLIYPGQVFVLPEKAGAQ